MQIRLSSFVVFLVFSNFLVAQENLLFWKRLKNSQQSNIIINAGTDFPESDWDTLLKGKFASPLKLGNEVYGWIGGTGRLYKMQLEDSVVSRFKRIDSTEALLYNIGAFPFVYGNNIYTLGGAGIWRSNGQLRVFNFKAKEWDIVKLNKEIPVLTGKEDGCLWYNSKEGKIYVGYYLPINDALKEESKPVSEVYVLDLEKKEWSKLGVLNPEFSASIGKFRNYGISPLGLFSMIDDRFFIFNFEQNKVHRLKESTSYRQSLIRSFGGSTFYFIDSTLFVYNAQKNIFDSLKISLNDFDSETVPLYKKEQPSFFYFLFIVPVFIGLIGFLFWRKRKQNIEIETKKPSLPSEIVNPKLSNAERDVLLLMLNNSESGKYTTIDELNAVMGVSKKGVDIQKKQRSDMLLSINRKLSGLASNDKLAIDKVRSTEDGRIFEYFIDNELLPLIKDLIENNKSGYTI